MASGPIPMVCLVCKHTPGAYYGRLVFPSEMEPAQRGDHDYGLTTPPPQCPNHKGKSLEYPLTPVNTKMAQKPS